MPNWCNNNLTITGDADALQDFIARSIKEGEDKEDYLTFQGTVLRPKELDITSGTSTDNGRDVINAEENNDWKGIEEKLAWSAWTQVAEITSDMPIETQRLLMLAHMKKGLTEENIAEARQSFKNKELFGHTNWYDWNIANWGTKWDAANSSVNKVGLNELNVAFDTAWAPPIAWVEKCETMYPLLSFSLDYEESGMGFAGTYCEGVNVERECTQYEDDNES